MKRIISTLLCLVLVFTCTACGNTAKEDSVNSSDDTSIVTSSQDNTDSDTDSDTASVEAVSSENVSSVAKPVTPVKIMPLGDSLTQGGQHKTSAYRGFLSEMLTADGLNYQFVGSHNWSADSITDGQVMHSGYGGATIFTLEKELPSMADCDPDIVLLMIGRNDTTQGMNGPYFIELMYTRVISKLFEMYPGVMVYCASVPPCRGSNGAENLSTNDNAQTVSYEALKAMIAEKKAAGDNIEFVDMSAAASGLTWEDFTADDFVHPLPEGYKKIAVQWHNAIKDKVAEIDKKLNA